MNVLGETILLAYHHCIYRLRLEIFCALMMLYVRFHISKHCLGFNFKMFPHILRIYDMLREFFESFIDQLTQDAPNQVKADLPE